MKYKIFALVTGSILVSACALVPWGRSPAAPFYAVRRWENYSFSSNGERIYFTATDDRGNKIEYSGGPDFGGMMMGSYLSCVSCHGPDGGGGEHYMHMWRMDAPDIRYQVLNSEMDEHGEEGGDYDLEDFRQAVIDGHHQDGDRLDTDMPRWQLDDQDLADLFAYLKTLP